MWILLSSAIMKNMKILILLCTSYAVICMLHWPIGFTLFTQLSNLFAAAVVGAQLYEAKKQRQEPRTSHGTFRQNGRCHAVLHNIKFTAVLSIFVTFLVYLLALARLQPGGVIAAYMQDHGASLCMHLINPMLMLADFYKNEVREEYGRNVIWYGLIPPAIYLFFIFLLGACGVRWYGGTMSAPYPFLNTLAPAGWFGFRPGTADWTTLGIGVAYSVVLLALLVWGLSCLQYFMAETVRKRTAFLKKEKSFRYDMAVLMKGVKMIMRVLGVLILVCLAVTAVFAAVYRKAASAIWHNWTAGRISVPETDEWTGGTSYLQIPYAEESENQYLDLYVPDMENGERPQLYVIIHGGGFVANDSQSKQAKLMYRYFRDQGYACATINYRLAQEQPFPAAIQDCKAAIRFLRAHADEYGYTAEKVAVFGESAGGFLAIMCSVTNDTEFNELSFIGQDMLGDVTSRVDVLVDYYGLADSRTLEEEWSQLGIPGIVRRIANSWIEGDVLQGYEDIHSYWLRKNISEMTAEEYAKSDPYAYIAENDLSYMKSWIVHGDADITVPYLQSVNLTAKLAEEYGEDAVSFQLVSGMGHASDPLYSDDMLAKLKEYLERNLTE